VAEHAGTQLVPVGHDLGAFHDGVGGHCHQVRVGAEIVELDVTRHDVWTAAHGTIGADGVAAPATEEALRSVHGDESVTELMAKRLIARTTPSDEFAATHRLVPLVLGLGNTVEEPWLFAAGLLYQPVVMMTGAVYDLWQWAHLSPDLRSACHESAKAATQAGVTDVEQTDPDRVLTGALASLPQLVAARAACFDVRIEGVG
jgi:hypothetical protein